LVGVGIGVGLADRFKEEGPGEMGDGAEVFICSGGDLRPPPDRLTPATLVSGGEIRLGPAVPATPCERLPPAAREEVGLSTALVMIEARLGPLPGAVEGDLVPCPGPGDAPGRGGKEGDEVVVGEFLA
jgi:hypothetical protein